MRRRSPQNPLQIRAIQAVGKPTTANRAAARRPRALLSKVREGHLKDARLHVYSLRRLIDSQIEQMGGFEPSGTVKLAQELCTTLTRTAEKLMGFFVGDTPAVEVSETGDSKK